MLFKTKYNFSCHYILDNFPIEESELRGLCLNNLENEALIDFDENLVLNKIVYTIEHGNIDNEVPIIEDLIREGYNPIDIASALLKLQKGK